MGRPQRGQIEQVEAQVMPQLEHVLVVPPPAAPLTPGQETQPPFAPFVVAPPTGSKAQLDCGKSGNEKNSSHTPCSPYSSSSSGTLGNTSTVR